MAFGGTATAHIFSEKARHLAQSSRWKVNMFSEMNAHKYLFMQQIEESPINRLRLVLAEGGAIADGPEIAAEEMPNAELRKVLKGSKPIQVKSHNAHYEISFNSYIAYALTSVAFSVDCDDDFDGRIVGTYAESEFLSFVEKTTYATQEQFGPFKHYCFWCFHQKIDVISRRPPVVKLMDV